MCGRKSASHCWRTKSTETQWQTRKWKHNFRDCRLEKKEEVAVHRKRLNAVWRRWWNRFSLWERIRRGPSSMLSVKFYSTNSRPSPLPCKCQEEKKAEETVNMNKSKAEPVSSWCHSCQAGSIKLHQRAVLELDLPRARGVPGEGGSAGRGKRSIQIARTAFWE